MDVLVDLLPQFLETVLLLVEVQDEDGEIVGHSFSTPNDELLDQVDQILVCHRQTFTSFVSLDVLQN